LLAAALAAAALAAGAGAAAQGDDMTRAKEAFSRGQAAFEAERYEEARAAFQESLAAFPHFRTLFNIALCDEKLGDVRGAIDMYQRYVDWPADVPNRDGVAAKIAELKAQLPPEPEPPPAPPPGDGPEPEPPPAPRPAEAPRPDLRVPGWIAVGVGAAGVVAGGVLLGLAQRKKGEMEAVDGEVYDPAAHDAILEDGRAYEKAGWISGGLGVLVAAAGAVLLLVSGDGADEAAGGGAAPEVVPAVGPDGAAAVARWRF